MPISIDVLSIKNNMHQLNALPVGESIEILFTSKPSLDDISRFISLTRLEEDYVWPAIGDPNYKQIQYVKERFGSVDVSFEYSGTNTVSVIPSDNLSTNSKYLLYVEKGLPPQYYAVEKTVTRGNSSVSVITNSNPITETAEYEIVVSETSILSNGTHTVGISLFRDNVQILTSHPVEIYSTNIELNQTTSIKLSSSFPFIVGEKFTVSIVSADKLSANKMQEIQTYLDADVIKTEDNPSQRIQYEDILGFYESAAFKAILPTQGIKNQPLIRYTGISSFVLVFPEAIEVNSIDKNTFSLNFSEAFGNYLLSGTDDYDPDLKYVVTIKVLSNTEVRFTIRNATSLDVVSSKYTIVMES